MFKNYSYLMSLGHMCSDMPQGLLSAVLPTLIATYHYDYTTAASLMMIFSLAGSFVQPFFGVLADKWNQPWLIILALVMADGAMCSIGFMDNFWILALMVTISGIGVAMFHPQAALTVNKLSADNNRGKNISIFSFGGQMGFTLGPALTTLALYYVGVRGTLIIIFPALVVMALMFLAIPDLKKIGENAAQKAKSKARALVDNWHGFAFLCGCIFGRTIINTGMITFLALYCINVLGMTKTQGTSVLSVFFAVSALATLLGGNMADKYGFRHISKISFSLLVPALVVLAYSRNFYLSMLALLPIGIAISLSYSPMVVLGQLYLPHHAGLASGVTLGLSVSVGGIFSPCLGKIADLYGLEYAFYTLAVLAVFSLTMSFFMPSVAGDEKSDAK